MKTEKRGRPTTGAALSNAERQKNYRERIKNELLELREATKADATESDKKNRCFKITDFEHKKITEFLKQLREENENI